MKREDWLEQWGLSSLKLNLGFLQGDFTPKDPDRDAAWDLYVELLTRITTQKLADSDGDEATALESVHKIFGLTRDIMKQHKRCNEFAKIAIPVLNQVIRPFTARWHVASIRNGFIDPKVASEFRTELAALQVVLQKYSCALSDMAGVEDLTELEDPS